MANLNAHVFQKGDKEFHLLANYDGMPVSEDQFNEYKRKIGVTTKQQQQEIAMVKCGERLINIVALKSDLQLGRAMVLSKYNLTQEELDDLLKLKTTKQKQSK